MRVLHVLPSVAAVQGGPAHSTLAAIRAVAQADPDLHGTLLSTDYRLEPEWEAELRDRLPPTVDLVRFPFYGRHTAGFSPALVRWMHRHVRRFDVAVIRAQMHPLSTAAAWTARRRGVPYVLTPHGTLSHYTFAHRNTRPKRLYYRLAERPLIDAAAAVQCTTSNEARELAERGCRAPIRVVPHPFEPESRPASRAVPGRVLFLSRLDPMKGLDVLLPALAIVSTTVPQAHLLIAGTGAPAYEYHLRAEVQRLGLADRVTFVGFARGDAKRALLAEASVFALPSHRENFGIAVVEALAAGLPAVVSPGVDIGGDLAAAGAGTVAARTPEATAEAIAALLSRPEQARAMGAQGRTFVERAFAPEVVGRQLLHLYREAAGLPS